MSTSAATPRSTTSMAALLSVSRGMQGKGRAAVRRGEPAGALVRREGMSWARVVGGGGVGTLWGVDLVGQTTWPASLVGAILGFLVGWGSALLTDWVTPADETPAIAGRSAIVRDPIVQGSLAVIWAAIPLLVPTENPLRWLAGGLLSVPLVQVAVTDL